MSTDCNNISAISNTSGAQTEHVSSVGEVDRDRGTALQRRLSEISTLLTDQDTEGLDDFTELKANVNRLKKSLDNLERLRRIYGENTAALSFSEITKKHLTDRLGVKIICPVEDDVDAFEKIISSIKSDYSPLELELESSLYAKEKWDHDFLKHALSRYDKHVFKYSEASARVGIDHWLLALAKYLDEVDNKEVLLVHELNIASNKVDSEGEADTSADLPEGQVVRKAVARTADQPSRVDLAVVKYEDQVTVLSGSTDYALLAEIRPVFNHSVLHVLQKSSDLPSEGMTLKDLLDIQGPGDSAATHTSLGQMLVIEAKSFKEVLAKHISQVIAQCIAILRLQRPGNGSIGRLPFCLTNGIEWIFGVIVAFDAPIYTKTRSGGPSGSRREKVNRGNDNSLYTVYLSPSIIPSTHQHISADRHPENETYHLLTECLLIWAKVNPDEIEDAFEKFIEESDEE